MNNPEISRIFRDIARMLEIKGDNPFRIRAYERAAQNINGLTQDIRDFIPANRLTEIPGIGQDLARSIKEFFTIGRIKRYEQLKKSIPQGMLEMLDIPCVGPKTVRLLYEKLKIKNMAGLERAIKQNKLQGIAGIKEKTVKNILHGIELLRRGKERMPLGTAEKIASEFIGALKMLPEVKKISPAGSLRRQKETVRDIDILAVSNNPDKVMAAFARMASAEDVSARGETKSSLRTKDGVQVDCRVVEEKSFGAALLYFTGAKNFNIKLRIIAQRRGLKINEYGVFRKGRYIAGYTEEGIFKLLGMPYIEPELREDTGEIELAEVFKLPDLIKPKDIKGDLHVHSHWSDGSSAIAEIVQAARQIGYSYIAVTDHSQGLRVAGGLSLSELKKKKKEIDRINKKNNDFRVLYGTEVDIDSEGKLDYKDEILKEFDIVVAAIHSGFKQSRERLGKRLTKACTNKYVHIIAHPTGKLWGVREAYDIDIDSVLKAARDTNTHFEINAFPQRMDFNDLNCRRAKTMGVKLAINTDAHASEHLETIGLGIAMARRGWLSAEDVINTLPLNKLLEVIKK